MTPLVVRGVVAENSAVTEAVGTSTSFSTLPWGLVLVGPALLVGGVLVWMIRRRRNRPVPVERLGLPSLAGGPFALAAGPAYEADASQGPDHDGVTEPPWARWPFAPSATTGERQRAEDIARIMAEALREMGPVPSCAKTNHLAEQMALIIVSELRDGHDLGLNAGVALTACITDELSHELRRLGRTAP